MGQTFRAVKLPIFVENRQVHATLTDREVEFIRLRIGEELSNKEIAERMHVTKRTAKWYAFRVSVRIGVSKGDYSCTLIAMTKWAILHGLVALESAPEL